MGYIYNFLLLPEYKNSTPSLFPKLFICWSHPKNVSTSIPYISDVPSRQYETFFLVAQLLIFCMSDATHLVFSTVASGRCWETLTIHLQKPVFTTKSKIYKIILSYSIAFSLLVLTEEGIKYFRKFSLNSSR